MKFSLVAATLAIAAGSVSAVHPVHSCTETHTALVGETCQTLVQKYNVAQDDLYRWNHGLQSFGNDKCNNLKVGKEYCVKAPKTKAKRCLAEKKKNKKKHHEEKKKKEEEEKDKKPAKQDKKPSESNQGNVKLNKANHIVPNCKKFYTITPEDTGCEAVAAKNGINVEQLYAWNKGLHHKGEHICDNLDTGKAYCVGV
ncbi:hypothetical protein EC973_000727 [Apophysomyces ossiformis]|uniref:LysM domain-containing protein n=1 Tax=Apophysomyces ossiformis TaxID=679940 RepID=A0A8H7ENQ1_9FUNG|nr:hypothetical protein EC973_000727 [Apophysomyces ossiformis]